MTRSACLLLPECGVFQLPDVVAAERALYGEQRHLRQAASLPPQPA